MTDKPKLRRGFALLPQELRRIYAAKGGSKVEAKKRSYSQNRELAVASGRKGGSQVPAEKRSFSRNHELAIAAGRKGGLAKQKKKMEKTNADEGMDLLSNSSLDGTSRGRI